MRVLRTDPAGAPQPRNGNGLANASKTFAAGCRKEGPIQEVSWTHEEVRGRGLCALIVSWSWGLLELAIYTEDPCRESRTLVCILLPTQRS